MQYLQDVVYLFFYIFMHPIRTESSLYKSNLIQLSASYNGIYVLSIGFSVKEKKYIILQPSIPHTPPPFPPWEKSQRTEKKTWSCTRLRPYRTSINSCNVFCRL